MARLGVAGWPVAHSRSPAMHNAALAELGLDRDGWHYLRLPLPPEVFAETVRALPALGFRGINVTIPHKEAALALAAGATPAARAIGAANTLSFDPSGEIHADNTDAPGLLEVIPPSHDPRGRTALVLGAGGAARAALHALLHAGAADVAVHNRTRERAERMVAELGGGRVVDAPVEADIVVNATSVGLAAFKAMPLPADTVIAGSCVVDMVYRDGGTKLLQTARQRGAIAIDGLDVLVAQGAASLERWTGRPAPRDTMRRAVRSPNQP